MVLWENQQDREKSLPKPMKRQRYNIQISEITNKKGDIRKNSEETQTIDH
jgi:hypothetical protein